MRHLFSHATTATAGLAALISLGAAAPAAAQMAPVTRTADDPALAWSPCPPIFAAGCEVAVLHGDPAQPNADVFLRTPSGYVFPAHSHTSAERMILIAGELAVHYRGAEPATLTVGDYAFGPAGLPHDASCAGEAPCVLFIAFEGPVDAVPFDGSLD
jgi:quercetin dioxygenase-like cupin family protein